MLLQQPDILGAELGVIISGAEGQVADVRIDGPRRNGHALRRSRKLLMAKSGAYVHAPIIAGQRHTQHLVQGAQGNSEAVALRKGVVGDERRLTFGDYHRQLSLYALHAFGQRLGQGDNQFLVK